MNEKPVLQGADIGIPQKGTADTPLQRPSIDFAAVLAAAGEVAYEWDISSDQIFWSDNAPCVLGVTCETMITTGRHYASLIAVDSPLTRYEAIMSGDAEEERIDSPKCWAKEGNPGTPFLAQYRLLPEPQSTAAGAWLEDSGRWFAGADGKPVRAFGVVRVVTARRHEVERLTYLSRYDDLTGQLNRVELLDALGKAFDEALDNRRSMVLAIARVDNLDRINHAYGFDAADRVIAKVGHRLKSTLRAGDAIGRISGNKFGIVLRDCGENDFEVASQRLVATVSDRIVTTEFGHVSTSISIGGVLAPADARTPTEALARAHEALDHARKHYRGGTHLFHSDDRAARTRRRNVAVADQIIAGLDENRLRLAYQPIVHAATGAIAYHEALLRMDRPADADGTERADKEPGPDSPPETATSGGALIAIAEELGLIRLIDERVRDLAFCELTACPQARLSVNVSADSVGDGQWLDRTTAMLAANPDLATRIVFEITETAVVSSLAEAERFVQTLHDHGAKVAIDDFGSGYTSFHGLKTLGADLVKIDGTFITALSEPNAREEVFIRALIDIARAFDMKTVAEWVRDRGTAERLKELGVDYFQGEMYGLASNDRPWPPAD